MKIFGQSPHITVQPEDCVFEDEHTGYTTEYDQSGFEAMDAEVREALARGHGHLTADHAFWLHEHHIAWEISVERRR